MMPTVVIDHDRAAAIDRHIAESEWTGIAPETVREMPSVLTGSHAEVIAQLREWRERLGLSYIIFRDDRIDELAPIVAELAGT
jgi:hypothetical protein